MSAHGGVRRSLLRWLVPISLLIAAVIHLLPLTGVLGSERLAGLYGIAIVDPDLLILMRHRAVLFGLLGVFLGMAASRPAWRSAAFAAGLVSVVSFLVLAWTSDGYNAALGRVVVADLVALVALLVGAGLHLAQRGRAHG